MTLEPPQPAPAYRDRKTGLVVFGIFEILLGAMAGLMLLVSLFGQILLASRSAEGVQIRLLLPSLAVWGLLAIALVWLGIGSISARRWARAVSVCLGAIGLASGVIGCVSLIWILPGLDVAFRQASEQSGQEMPAVAVIIAKVVAAVMMFLMYIVIPGALWLFYRSRHVKLTCEARDPVPRWTDRCPLPVLALVLMQAFGAVSMLLLLPTYGRAFPWFGVIVTGLPATAIYIVFALLSAYVARGFYRLEPPALWIYVGMIVVLGAGMLFTWGTGGLMMYYREIGLPERQLRQIEAMPLLHSPGVVWFAAICGVIFLGYVVWLRRYFVKNPSSPIAAG